MRGMSAAGDDANSLDEGNGKNGPNWQFHYRAYGIRSS
jgi:hypothetical protein